MKKIILSSALFLCANVLCAQITILDEDVKEKIVSKPQVLDSLSNITFQKDPIQYKQYIGYKLYSLPISSKYKCKGSECSVRIKEFKLQSPQEYILPHTPYEQSSVGMAHNNMAGYPRDLFQKDKEDYDRSFVIMTDLYNATSNGTVYDKEPNNPRHLLYNAYESIQNSYYTILNIETSFYRDGPFFKLEEWDNNRYSEPFLRFTLKNEITGEEIYWIPRSGKYINEAMMFLVPYFEKMQKTYKGKQVMPTTKIERLADINTGEPVNIQPGEVWHCYDVTFINLEDQKFVKPYFLLEKNGEKIMISFDEFTKKCEGIFTNAEEGYTNYPMFMLEQDYNEIIAKRKHSAEERQRLEEEMQRQKELARQEYNKQIIHKYGNKYGTLICDGKVCLNMTKEMCIAAWGEPLYVNSTIVKGLVHEQWVYGWHTYLYFDNNILTAIQN